MPLPLPVEMTDYIIDLMHNNRAALLACSLVSPSFRDRAQHNLFRSATLCKKQRVEVPAHLCVHIQSLHLPALLDSTGCANLLRHGPLLGVTRLALEEPDFDSYEMLKCNDIPIAQMVELLPNVREITIDNIQLHHSADLMCILAAFPRLVSTQLRCVYIDSHSDSPLPSHSQLALPTLLVDNCSTGDWWLERLEFPLPLQSLRRLELRDVDTNYIVSRAVGALAAQVASTLQELDIEAPGIPNIELFSYQYTKARPAAEPALSSLRLCVRGSIDTESDLVRCIQLVREIAPGALAHITLAFLDPPKSTSTIQWTAVADELSRLPFPWKCTLMVTGLNPGSVDGHVTLESLGVTLVGVP